MSLMRWDPLPDPIGLRQAMDSLLEQSLVHPRSDAGATAFGLAVDVEDRGDAYAIEAAIPGSAPEDVEISVIGDMVRLRAERRESRQESDPRGSFLVREQRYGVFERALRLPTSIDAGAAQANFRDGVLRIVLPKSPESREHRIPVQAASGRGDRPLSAEAESGQSQTRGAPTDRGGSGPSG